MAPFSRDLKLVCALEMCVVDGRSLIVVVASRYYKPRHSISLTYSTPTHRTSPYPTKNRVLWSDINTSNKQQKEKTADENHSHLKTHPAYPEPANSPKALQSDPQNPIASCQSPSIHGVQSVSRGELPHTINHLTWIGDKPPPTKPCHLRRNPRYEG